MSYTQLTGADNLEKTFKLTKMMVETGLFLVEDYKQIMLKQKPFIEHIKFVRPLNPGSSDSKQ